MILYFTEMKYMQIFILLGGICFSLYHLFTLLENL